MGEADFMRQKVLIQLAGVEPVPEPEYVSRYLVEALAKARVKTETGERLLYPFSIIKDTEEGREWLAELLTNERLARGYERGRSARAQRRQTHG